MTRLSTDDAPTFRDGAALFDHYAGVRARLGLAPTRMRRPDPVVPAPVPPIAPPPPPPPPRPPADPEDSLVHRRIRAVREVVAIHFGVNPVALGSMCKLGRLTWPRQVAMAITRRVTARTWEEIGEAFAGRSHSTVMRSAEKVEAQAAADPRIAADLAMLETKARAAIQRRHR